MQIRWSRTALNRMEVLLDFIATRRPAVAERVIDDLFDRISVLAEQPNVGRVFPGSAEEAIRQMLFGKYRVTYHVDAEQGFVTILTVQHTREQPVELEDLPRDDED